MISVELTSEAKDDLFDAVDYYEDKERGLGRRLRDEVATILNTVLRHPIYGESARRDIGVSIAPSFHTT